MGHRTIVMRITMLMKVATIKTRIDRVEKSNVLKKISLILT